MGQQVMGEVGQRWETTERNVEKRMTWEITRRVLTEMGQQGTSGSTGVKWDKGKGQLDSMEEVSGVNKA